MNRAVTFTPYMVKTDSIKRPGSESFRYVAELGRLMVPENRKKSNSRLIELAFVRLKSTASEPGPPLIFLAGGPGVSGVEGVRYAGMKPWLDALRSVGDVIMLDQRGVGMSRPCLDAPVRWNLPLDVPGSREEMVRMACELSAQSAQFWSEQGVDLAGYTTEESADDIDDLRKALGVEKVNLYGASYGSHLALATIKRHGAHIERAIIALVEGLDHTLKLPSNVQRHLAYLSQLVKEDSRLNGKIPDLLELMQSVLQRLEREPVMVEVEDGRTGKKVQVCVGKFDLQLATASGIGERDALQKLPARYYAMSQGDFSWVAGEVLEMRRKWLDNAMSYMMDCASGVSAERARRIREEAPTTLLEDVVNLPFPDVSEAWGAPDLGPAFRAPLQTDVPALFISGTMDGRTPISNAEEVRSGFAQSEHVIVKGATHSTLQLVNAAGVTEAMVAFLKGERLLGEYGAVPFVFAPLD